MANSVHVLIRSILRAKLASTGLALECRSPVVQIVHVLIASTPGTEASRTGLAVSPVAAVVHVFVTNVLPVEFV